MTSMATWLYVLAIDIKPSKTARNSTIQADAQKRSFFHQGLISSSECLFDCTVLGLPGGSDVRLSRLRRSTWLCGRCLAERLERNGRASLSAARVNQAQPAPAAADRPATSLAPATSRALLSPARPVLPSPGAASGAFTG
jgi:hypothetical protein